VAGTITERKEGEIAIYGNFVTVNYSPRRKGSIISYDNSMNLLSFDISNEEGQESFHRGV